MKRSWNTPPGPRMYAGGSPAAPQSGMLGNTGLFPGQAPSPDYSTMPMRMGQPLNSGFMGRSPYPRFVPPGFVQPGVNDRRTTQPVSPTQPAMMA